MLLSMTGYGEARHQSDALTLAIEVRGAEQPLSEGVGACA